jgi:hypothetical protein
MSYFDNLQADQVKAGMQWMDVCDRCNLITRIVPSAIANHLDIYCEGTKASIGEGVREPAIDIHNVRKDQVMRVKIGEDLA